MTATVTIIEPELVFTIQEVSQYVYSTTGRLKDSKQAYRWLEFCLISEAKHLYTLRDLKKFLCVAHYLFIDRSIEAGRKNLEGEIQACPKLYQDEIYVAGFLDRSPTVQLARRKLDGKRGGNSIHSRGGRGSGRKEPKLKQIEELPQSV